MNKLAHARAGLPTPDKRTRQSVWEAGFGARFDGEAGGRWRCAACKCRAERGVGIVADVGVGGKNWRDDPKIVQRHLREEHHVLTTTVVTSKEEKATDTVVVRS